MIINPCELTPGQLYQTMIQTIIPRPIAWVLTDNGFGSQESNNFNVAPFSYFSPVCTQPPVLMISIGKKPDGSLKDTRLNIIERKHFVVHIASSALAEVITATSSSLPFGESEVERFDLGLAAFEGFSLPRLSSCKIAYGCELMEVKEIGDVPQAIIFGLVKTIYIADDLVEENNGRSNISALKLEPLGRLGGDQYWVGGKVVTIKRPL